MIKRRYYKLEHGDKDAPSESSSSSDSELGAEATDESEEDIDEDDVQARQEDEYGSSASGYESEDSSAHEVNLDSSGLPTSDEDVGPQRNGQNLSEGHSFAQGNTDSVDLQLNIVANKDEKDGFDVPDCVVKCKSVFKCRLCPRIVCLSEETLNAHLKSKRHARSEKLLGEGRLKLMLDIDGKFEEETAPTVDSAEVLSTAPTVASPENSGNSHTQKRGWRGKKSKIKKRSGAPRMKQAKKRHINND